MAKRAESTYRSGIRTDDWLKIKTSKRQEVVIAGFTAPRRTRPFF
jgi:bifunctional non-homologous end joining protein LigD